jgi:chromosome segregation protein
MLMRMKNHFEETKEKLGKEQEQISKLQDYKKGSDEKNTNLKFQNNHLKVQLREKDAEITKLKLDIEELEAFKYEKDRFEKDAGNNNKMVNSLKEDCERKSRRIRELEKQNEEFKNKIDDFVNKASKQTTSSIMNQSHKDKDRKIKQLEQELQESKEVIDKKESGYKMTEQAVEDFTYKEDEYKRQIEELRAEIKKQVDELQTESKRQIEELQGENNKLKDTLKKYEGFIMQQKGIFKFNS